MRASRVVGLCSVAALCVSATVSAQDVVPKPVTVRAASAASKFAAEPYVLERSDRVDTMRADGTGERVQTFVIDLQSEAAVRSFSVLSILISSDYETGEFTYVRVVHADGTTQETPVSSAIQQPAPVTQQAPWYSDLQTKQIPVRSMRVGDRLEWQAKFTQTKPYVPGQFWSQDEFTEAGVCLERSVELRVPAGLHVTVWTNPRPHIDFAESDREGQHIYHWQTSNLKPTVGPDAEAQKKKEAKRLRTADEELDDSKGELTSMAWTTFSDWAALGAWYRGLLTDRLTPDAAIQAKVTELTAGKKTDLERAQAIYNYVSTRIRYIGVNFGIGKLQPHTAAEVFANQFGDCKDKHVLLASMLQAAGIQSDPVLIGAGVRFNPGLPSPASFNHMITRAWIDGKPVWLDATAESGIWAALLKPLRDQQALVLPASGPALVQETPVDLPFPQTTSFKIEGSLDGDLTSNSTITVTMHGDDELTLRALLHDVSPANYSEFVQRMMAAMGFGGTTSDPAFENLDDPGKPLQMSFHYRRVKEKDWGENRVTAAFLMIALPAYNAENPPTESIQLGSPRVEDSTIEIELPKGWTAQPPQPVHAHKGFATCDVTFEVKNGKLMGERRLAVLATSVKVSDASKYESWYEDCGASGVPFVQLIPAPKATAIATAPLPATLNPDATAGLKVHSDPEAAKLVQQAFDSMRAHDLDTARQSLDKAAAINPTQASLWYDYATLSFFLGQRTKMVEYGKRELAYHPEELKVYPNVSSWQRALNDKEGSLQTLRDWVKAAPDSADAPLQLGWTLSEERKSEEALKVAQSALARLGEGNAKSVELRILQAVANSDLGHAADAAREIAPLLDTVTEPKLLNNISYVLAQGGVRLSDAAAAESRFIETAEAETSEWPVTMNLEVARDKQQTLARAWDTMAWVLYRQGKLEDALAYADAARHGSSDSTVRDHFTAIARATEKPAAIASAKLDDQGLRTFRLGPSHGESGVAPVQLLLADGKVLDAKPATDMPGRKPLAAEQRIHSVDFHALFPPGSKAHLIRLGMINCHQEICELVLAPL